MRFMNWMAFYGERMKLAFFYFFGPSIVVAVLTLLLARWIIGSEWLRPPVDTKNYLPALLTAGGILAALASVQVQILHTMRMLPNPKGVLTPAMEFTKLAAWMFAGGVPVIIITLVLGLSDLDFIGVKTIIAGLQYLVLGLFTAGWFFLYAGSVREPS